MKLTFPRQIMLTLCIAAVLSIYPLIQYATYDILIAVITGTAIATVNILIGYVTIEYSFGKSLSSFLKFIIGGMLFRLVFLLSIIFLLVRFFNFHVVALLCSLGFFYIVYLVMEILFIQNKVNLGQNS